MDNTSLKMIYDDFANIFISDIAIREEFFNFLKIYHKIIDTLDIKIDSETDIKILDTIVIEFYKKSKR